MRRHSEGIALIAALTILLVVALLVLGTVFSTQIESWTTRNDTTSTQAYYVAHAGLQKYETMAFQTYRYYLDNLQLYGKTLPTAAMCGNLLAGGLDLNRNQVIGDAGDLLPGASTGKISFGGGTYDVTFQPNGSDVVLTSVGIVNGARSTVQVVFQPLNAGLFSNALFAGGGISSKYINGGAQVWGSVYIEGDPSAATPPTVLNSNGNFSMHNYYDQSDLLNLMGNQFTSSQLQDMLGNTATDQKDLCARMRVAGGQIDTGGSTLLGDSSAPTGYVPALKGVNVGSGLPDITTSGSSDIFADNYPGGNVAYDLSKPLQLPSLDPNNPTACKSGGTWKSCLEGPGGSNKVPSSCIPGAALSNSTVTFGTTDFSCSWTDSNNVTHSFSYSYDSTNNKGTLAVSGLVDFEGYDLHFAQNVATKFSGKATIVATADSSGTGGNITVDGDVLPTQDFPQDDVLGLIAENDLTFTGSTQNQLVSKTQTAVGLFYAGHQASIEKGAVVLGTVLADGISTSSGNAGQTAKVIQVPGLEYNLSPGFTDIPNDVLATFQIVSYQRR